MTDHERDALRRCRDLQGHRVVSFEDVPAARVADLHTLAMAFVREHTTEPTWHNHPPEPGWYVVEHRRRNARGFIRYPDAMSDDPTDFAEFYAGCRFYGPIPTDEREKL